MKLLFVHQGFPAQYIHILRALSAQGGHTMVALGIEEADTTLPTGVQYFRYGLARGNQPGLHPWVLDIESKVLRAEACANAAATLKQQGFTPDLICSHPGWGEPLFLKDVWPETPLLTYQEFFYNPKGFDYDFDPELQSHDDWTNGAQVRIKTANQLLNLYASDWSVTPTEFQKSSYPRAQRDRISVIHDGIDTAKACPNDNPSPIKLPDGTELNASDKIVTFVNRNLEPYRGCHSMIRAIPYIQELAPEAQIVIVGNTEGISYGQVCPEGEWSEMFLAEIEGNYDTSKVHFTGSVPYEQFIPLLQLSKAHVYLTYPFVLSWSLLEAMSIGCPVVGSKTPPVEEVIEHGKNGLLVDFFSPKDIAFSIAELLKNPKQAKELGKNARQTVIDKYELNQCVNRHLALLSLTATRSIGK